jgi:hypothetical protein
MNKNTGKSKQRRSSRVRNAEFIKLIQAIRKKPKIQLYRKLHYRDAVINTYDNKWRDQIVWCGPMTVLVTEVFYTLMTKHKKEFEAWMRIQTQNRQGWV